MLNDNKIPDNYAEFLIDTGRLIDANNINLNIVETESIDYLGHPAYGFFTQNPLTFGLAIGSHIDEWMKVCVHESCHMDQYLEKSSYWTTAHVLNIEAMDIVTLWVDRQIELNNSQLNFFITKIKEMEWDCERRTVEKFKKYNIDVNIEEYIQRANSYLFTYNFVEQCRAWNKDEYVPYHIPELWKLMPKTFDVDYTVTPVEYIEAYSLAFPDLRSKS